MGSECRTRRLGHSARDQKRQRRGGADAGGDIHPGGTLQRPAASESALGGRAHRRSAGALHGFTIAQISDLHVGPTIKRAYVEAVVDAVNALDVDMIAVTGDVVDGSVKQLAPHTEPLSRLASRHGSFFVTGNHEYYSGASAWIAEMRRLGLRVLVNEHVVLKHDGAAVVVAGVTDYSTRRFDSAHRSDPVAALAGAPRAAAVKLLLAHQPRSAFEAAPAGFDLQLSGHTHGGQFFPWNFFVRLQQPFTAGLHRL